MSNIPRAALTLALAAGTTSLLAAGLPAGLLFSSGPPDGRAAAPPDFIACNICHTGAALNGGDGTLAISGPPAEYTPGTTYTVTVTLEDPGQKRWGFELTALDESGAGAGTLTVIDPVNTQKSVSGGRQYLKHTSAGTFNGTMNGPVSWSFDWTAPPAGSGTVFFYAAGNAANGNLNTVGDVIYTAATASAEAGAPHADATLVLQPDTIAPRRGSTWTVRARVRHTSTTATSVLLVSRVKLGPGSFFPPTGFLLPPITVNLSGGNLVDEVLLHAVPSTAPLITATYEGFLGIAPATLVDDDSFSFTVAP